MRVDDVLQPVGQDAEIPDVGMMVATRQFPLRTHCEARQLGRARSNGLFGVTRLA